MRWLLYLFVITISPSCYLLRAYKVRHFNLTDHERLPSVSIAGSTQPYHAPTAQKNKAHEQLINELDSVLPGSLTAAFLVLKNDSVVYERYFNGFSDSSLLPSYSVAKSFVSTLLFMAADEGKIHSLQDPVTLYLPELLKKDGRFSKITLQQLLDMKSGLQFNEGLYSLKDDAIKLGLRPNLLKHVLKVKIEKDPGGEFNYQSINTELLALVIERSTGKKISAYLQEKIWQPMGAEHKATWNVDSKKHRQEIAFAGINAIARDFARLGQLYLHKGQWQGKQLLDASWIEKVNHIYSLEKSKGYKNQWWSNLDQVYFTDSLKAVAFKKTQPYSRPVRKENNGYTVRYRSGAFHAEGLFNQFIYINPSNNVVIVRLGRNWHHPRMSAAEFIYQTGRRF